MAFVRISFLVLGIAVTVYGVYSLWVLARRRASSSKSLSQRRVDWIYAAFYLIGGIGLLVAVFTGEIDRELTSEIRIGRDFTTTISNLLPPGATYRTALRFKEPLVNFLDLLSFIFVTPEIVERYSSSAAFSRLVGFASFTVAVATGALLFWLLMSAMIYSSGATHSTLWPVSSTWSMQHSTSIAAVIVALFVVAAIGYHVQFGEPLSLSAARRWLLKCGVVLFVGSRIFGIVAGLRPEEPPRCDQGVHAWVTPPAHGDRFALRTSPPHLTAAAGTSCFLVSNAGSVPRSTPQEPHPLTTNSKTPPTAASLSA